MREVLIILRTALIAAAIATATVGWASPATAQPPHIPQDTDITCPDIAGINYIRDANDSRAYYLCVDGEQHHHFRCPQVTILVMAMPPKCVPFAD
jgi:hypothetical protein